MTMTVEIERVCPQCENVMPLVHKGRFSTLHVCPGCGITLTIPPPIPVAAPKLRPD
jgi:hypothetical protein